MKRLLLGFPPALVVLILFAACGGGGGTTTTNAPAGTTAAASTTAAATTAATAAGTATDTGGANASATPTDTGAAPATMPDLPPGTIALTEYHVFPPTGDPISVLFTLPVTQAPPDGAKTYWYTYSGGKWTQLQEAYITGLRELQAQGSFDSTPADLIVLAVTS
jgi:hypothetical protein